MTSKNFAIVAGVVVVAAVGAWLLVGLNEPTTSASGPPTLLVTAPNSGAEFFKPTAQVSGTATPGSTVQVGHQGIVPVGDAGQWQTSITLEPGKNKLSFRAIKSGQFSQLEELTVTRRLTPEEKKAAAEAVRAEQKANAEMHAYARTTKEIPYAKLSANADKFENRRIALKGQVFQIQQGGEGQNYLLMSVTDDGFEWIDTVWVNYEQSPELDVNQIVNAYGTVVGERQYEAKEGGAKFVPQVDARYITVAR